MKKYVPILLLLFYSCNNNQCKENLAFKEKFFHNISLIEQLYNYEDSIHKLGLDTIVPTPFVSDSIITHDTLSYFEIMFTYPRVVEAIGYIESLTGIWMPYNLEGGPYFFDTPNINIEVLNTIQSWKKWYEQNKCIITLKRADSIYFEDSGAFHLAWNIHRKNFTSGEEGENRLNFLEDSIKQAWRRDYK